MPEYLVRWEIEVDADSPEEAVDKACQMLPVAGNDSIATVFEVVEWNGHNYEMNPVEVDIKDWGVK